MPSPKPSRRIEDEPAFVLHRYPYKETSLLCDVFTANHGRVALLAKGAKRPGSNLRAMQHSFQPLAVSFTGKAEVKTATRAEWLPGQAMLVGPTVMAGYYVNELMMKLLPREDAHPALFTHYGAVLKALGDSSVSSHAGHLRVFELCVLRELGFAMDFTRLADSDILIEAEETYRVVPERGVMRGGPAWLPEVSGATLCALAEGDVAHPSMNREAKRLLRTLIDHALERRTLKSRGVAVGLAGLGERLLDDEKAKR